MGITIIPTTNGTFAPKDDSVNILLEGSQINFTSQGILNSGANNVQVIIGGLVLAEDNGISLLGSGATEAGNSVTILESGRVLAKDYTGVDTRGDGSSVVNRGEILSFGTAGVHLGTGANLSLENHGLIEGYGANTEGVVAAQTTNVTIRNYGEIVSNAGATINTLANAGKTVLENDGRITSSGVAMLDGGADISVTNSGTISGRVVFGTGDATVINTGLMTSNSGTGLDFGAGGVSLVNRGEINGEDDTIVIAGGGNGIVNDGMISSADGNGIVVTNGSGTAITNNNKIQSYGDTILISGDLVRVINTGEFTSTAGNGLQIDGGNRAKLVNYGVISGFVEGVLVGGDDYRIINHGTISGLDGKAVALEIDSAGASAVLVNTGTLSTSGPQGTNAISGDAGDATSDIVRNSGFVEGWIDLNGGDDTLTNSGSIFGSIALGAGDDRFDGRGGTVFGDIFGGAGDDIYVLDDPDTRIVETAGEGTDTVRIAVSYALDINVENLDLLGASDADATGNDADNRIDGNLGDNCLIGFGGNDTITGDNGDDRIEGGAGDDSLFGGNHDDRILGGSGHDTIIGGSGVDVLFGELGDDSLQGNFDSDRLFGGVGNDTLDGGSGDDALFGGAGFDRLLGSEGNDTLTGNFNADEFVFTDFGAGFGSDVITDFEARNDFEVINLRGVAAITDFDDLAENHMTQRGKDVVIDAGGGNEIKLLDVDLAQLDAADFIF